MKNHKSHIKKHGWIETNELYTDCDILNFAKLFGCLRENSNGNMIKEIIPKKKKSGITGTLSNRFGFDVFPFHTDTAFWSKPARYILLNSVNETNCPTLLLKFEEVWSKLNSSQRKVANSAIYLVKTNNLQYYTSLIFNQRQRNIKYDPSCMIPVNNEAKEFKKILTEILNDSQIIEVNWTKGKTIVIDNWKMLHARAKISKNNSNRILKRVYIS